ncbi:MAG: SRPBCC family protein [Jatrophihabitantaceae bacterium]
MRHADRPTAEEQIDVRASPERIWPLVSDPGFLIATSPELVAVEWLAGCEGAPATGCRFVGTNANKHFGQWQTISTVIECVAPREFAWAVGDVDEPNTTWRFTLSPRADGTRVTQWMRLGSGPSGIGVAIGRMPDKEERIVARRLDEFHAAMRANLEAIKTHAEQG